MGTDFYKIMITDFLSLFKQKVTKDLVIYVKININLVQGTLILSCEVEKFNCLVYRVSVNLFILLENFLFAISHKKCS